MLEIHHFNGCLPLTLLKKRGDSMMGNLNTFREKNKVNVIAYAFILPALIIYVIFLFIPFFITFYYSTIEWDGVGEKVFVGFSNFKRLLTDTGLHAAFINNGIWLVFYVIGPISLGLLLALGITKPGIHGGNIIQAVYFIPYILSTVVVVMAWRWIFNAKIGILSVGLQAIGLIDEPFGILGDPNWALYALIFISIWRQFGFCTIIYVVGLQNIDPDIHDAARIDGANAIQRFFNVTLPGLSSVTTFLVLLQAMDSFKIFNYVFIGTNGGPARSTEVVAYIMYKESFIMNRVGYGSSIAVVLAIILLIFGIFYINAKEKKAISA